MPDLTTYNWAELAPSTPPSPRYHFDMVWDGTRIIMFGGRTTVRLNETWEFDGTDWNQLFPATVPTARDKHSMVWTGSRVIMFGGDKVSAVDPFHVNTNETWEFVGGNWNLLSPASSPSRREGAAMIWDGSRVLLYGGYGPSGETGANIKHDTWEFTGGNWNQLSPTNHIPSNVVGDASNDGRALMPMVWEGSRIVSFGGSSNAGANYQLPLTNYHESGGNTWIYNGDWSQPAPATDPIARFSTPIAITDDDNKILMYGGDITRVGGLGRAYDGTTWQFNGTNWLNLSKFGPGSRGNGKMVWDTIGNRFILFGGRATSSATRLGDTWEFAGVAAPPTEEPKAPSLNHVEFRAYQ